MSKKSRIVKIAILVCVILFCIALTVVLYKFVNSLMTDDGKAAVESFMKEIGIFGPLVFMAAEITQILLALIPGGPVEMIGGALFGPVEALILCEISIFLATVIIYNLVKKIGKPMVNMFVSEEKFKKFKFLHDEKKLELVVFIFLMIPGTPKDVITYIASLTEIKPLRFYIIAPLARIPALILCVVFGDSVQNRDYFAAVIVFLITAVVGITGILLNNRITTYRREKVERMKRIDEQQAAEDNGKEKNE